MLPTAALSGDDGGGASGGGGSDMGEKMRDASSRTGRVWGIIIFSRLSNRFRNKRFAAFCGVA